MSAFGSNSATGTMQLQPLEIWPWVGGQVVVVFGYVMMFINSLACVPQLVQQLSRLRDVSRRMST